MRNLYGWAIGAVALSVVSLCLAFAPATSNWIKADIVTLVCATIMMGVVAFGSLRIDPIAPPGARPALIVGFVLAAAILALEVGYVISGAIRGPRGWNPGDLTVIAMMVFLYSQGKLYGSLKSKPTFMRQ